jgi:hypothetical protein
LRTSVDGPRTQRASKRAATRYRRQNA